MIDIFIKSFNRAYYLDRSISSIKQNVVGDYHIKVLDDGTPQKYLDKIREKHPFVEIIKSKNYINKTKAIEENLNSGKEINGFTIPVDLWITEAKKASDYFIMTEDDVWFTEKTSIDDLVYSMKKNDVYLLKLGWLGNIKEDDNIVLTRLNDLMISTTPKKLFLSNEKIMEAFFLNKFKFYTILYKLGLVDNTTKNKYWALNSILMGLYKKEYWLEVWKNMNNLVDEKRQLINASVFYRKHRNNPNFIAKTNTEKLKTTFQSSATNSYHKYGYDFDVNYFNHLMNEAWYEGKLDSMQNYPKDFSQDYFESFFDNKINKEEFIKWANHFKNQYKELGCNVE